jgi:uncharacterized protein YdeI (BOF family)
MKALNTKLVLSALGIALLATPAFAQQSQRQSSPQAPYNYQTGNSDGYPNPVARSGSAEQAQSGAAFNLGRGY